MPEYAIQATDLRKSFGANDVVKGVSFAVEEGICFGLLGPNGAGKTTVIKMLLANSPYDSGSLHVLGNSIPRQGREARAHIGVVPQMDNLDPDFTVIENLRIYGRYFSMSRREIEARIPHLLRFVELEGKKDAKIESLSGGMKRRLVIARALIQDPRLIILDEPTTGLDPQVRHAIWSRLFALKKEGKTLLLTTHYLEEAERLCDKLLVMDKGVVLDTGSPKELIERHAKGEVVEICGIREDAVFDNLIATPGIMRYEQSADMLIALCSDAEKLLQSAWEHPELQVMHRPSNLEDVFLALTGRELGEG